MSSKISLIIFCLNKGKPHSSPRIFDHKVFLGHSMFFGKGIHDKVGSFCYCPIILILEYK